ncbi:hypothetical protein ACROYT_G006400, partial [Oculina patagonica]
MESMQKSSVENTCRGELNKKCLNEELSPDEQVRLKQQLSSRTKVRKSSRCKNPSNISASCKNTKSAQSDGQDAEPSLSPSNTGESNESYPDRKMDTEERPFKCTYCEKCFTNPEYLKVHERIHTGEKPYKCGECGKCFRQSSNLMIHKKIHS